MKKLYLDFDGVLVNTNEMWQSLLESNSVNLDDAEAKRAFLSRIKFSELLDKAQPINNSLSQINDLINSDKFRIKILTHVNSLDEAETKINFIKRLYPLLDVVIVPKTIDKNSLVNPKGAILVDDYAPNLKLWEEAGGIGVKFSPTRNSRGFTTVAALEELIQLFDEE